MAKLTEEMVVARTRASDLGSIRKLNCWGVELQDISLLRRLANVEVLSLSVNKISSLVDVQYCRNLRELYFRKNEIKNLNEICYLRDLPYLKALWLGENPCSSSDANYRLTVIKNLPDLEKLDDVKIEPEERQDAMKKGRELVHPEECDGSASPPQSPTRIPRSPPTSNRSSDHEQDSGGSRKSYSPDYEAPQTYPPERRYSQQHEQYDSRSYQNSRRPNDVPYDTNDSDSMVNNGGSVCDKCSNPLSPNHIGSEHNNRMTNHSTNLDDAEEPIPVNENHKMVYSHYSNHQYDRPVQSQQKRDRGDSPKNQGRGSYSEISNLGVSSPQRGTYNQEEDIQQLCDRSYRHCDQVIENTQRYEPERKPPPYPRRSVTRYQNSNILSAVLCLIRELDYASLEVVGIAVRCRMDEFED